MPRAAAVLEQITPLILTLNEEPNIGRALDRLKWARRVVVVDSLSDDDTERIAKSYPNVSFVQRRFDSHAEQWNFGLTETEIDSEWILAMDSDYILSDEVVEEIRALRPPDDVRGYRATFRYCVDGHTLPGTVYPPVVVLFRRGRATYRQDGHTQRADIDGRIETLRSPILHDDRKPLDRWLAAQARYMKLEADVLLGTPFKDLDLADKVRRMVVVAPPAMFFYSLFIKGNITSGAAGIFYSMQRATAEAILSLFLLQGLLKSHRHS